MTPSAPRNNHEWLADLRDPKRQAGALADLREYLLRAVFLYLDRRRSDLAHLERRELEHLAEDFAQEGLLQIRAKLDTFQGRSKFTTWAYPIVINIAAAELRLQRWRTHSLENLVSNSDASPLSFLGDQNAPDAETAAAREQILDLIRETIETELTTRQRFALVSVHFKAMPMAEVARLLGSSPNNVYKLIHDARKRLKGTLLRYGYGPDEVLALFSEK